MFFPGRLLAKNKRECNVEARIGSHEGIHRFRNTEICRGKVLVHMVERFYRFTTAFKFRHSQQRLQDDCDTANSS